jgi:hypothetical protein
MTKKKKWYRVSIRLMGDNLPVKDIESQLRIKPSYIGLKGQHFQDSVVRGRYETNLWGWRYPSESNVPFEKQITGLLKKIEPVKSELLAILGASNAKGELFLGFGSSNGQGGAYLSPKVLKRISDCGLAISLDLYPHDMDKIEAEELSMI